jgi:hypothetical protein
VIEQRLLRTWTSSWPRPASGNRNRLDLDELVGIAEDRHSGVRVGDRVGESGASDQLYGRHLPIKSLEPRHRQRRRQSAGPGEAGVGPPLGNEFDE